MAESQSGMNRTSNSPPSMGNRSARALIGVGMSKNPSQRANVEVRRTGEPGQEANMGILFDSGANPVLQDSPFTMSPRPASSAFIGSKR